MASGEEANINGEEDQEAGKAMTDPARRESRRLAAVRFRQRRKQLVANLEAEVEISSRENDALSAQVTQLREEVLNLKTILAAHEDCPLWQLPQVDTSHMQHGPRGDSGTDANPYSMAVQSNQQVTAGSQRYFWEAEYIEGMTLEVLHIARGLHCFDVRNNCIGGSHMVAI
ncbi:hypothetical protein MMC13_004114 [Lambiella insularis]|nr:hypothetical protein [Lambiella insularis]